MNRMSRLNSPIMRAGLAALLLTAMSSGCTVDVPQDEHVQRTVVVFDPDVPAIPLPNNLALDEEGNLPAVGDPTEDSPQGIFSAYFSSLHGWPVSTSISIPVDGEIDSETLGPDNLLIFKFEDDGGVRQLEVGQIGFDSAASEIQASASEPFGYGVDYAFALVGELKDTDGDPVVASQAIHFAVSSQPLVNEAGEPIVSLLEDDPETARTLEGLRQAISPVVNAALSADSDLKRSDILSASIWTTAVDPVAVLDADSATLPLPSDLALEEDGTMPNMGEDLPASAQKDFFEYLSTLHGWPAEMNPEIPISAPLVEESVTEDAVRFFRFEADDSVTVLDVAAVEQTVNADGTSTVEIIPDEPLEMGSFYGFLLTDDVKAQVVVRGEQAELPVIPDIPFVLARSTNPIVDEDGKSAVEQLSDEQAAQIEGIRQLLAPVYQAAEADGLSRDNIVAASFFHTALDAFADFDPVTGSVPFPNEFARDGNVDLPMPEGADELTQLVISELNSRYGFSTTADGWLPVSGAELDPATINSETILLARQPAGEIFPVLYEDDRYDLEYDKDMGVIKVIPTNLPFDQNQQSFGGEASITAGVITNKVKDLSGYEIKPSPAFVFLRSQHELFDEESGKSLVAQLDDASAAQLEDARIKYKTLFTAALAIGYPDREEIANAWAFEAEDATNYQQRLNAKAKALVVDEGQLAAAGDPATAGTPSEPEFSNIGLQQLQAAYPSKFFLDADAGLALMDEPVDQQVPITVSIPKTGSGADECGDGPFPVIILGHGLGGERAKAVDIFADALAAEPYCMASVALDFPFHGQREVPGVPFMSAQPVLTKNNFLQAVVDLTVLTEVIKAGGLEDVLDSDSSTTFIDTDKIGYAGQSLGGIIGVNFLATNDDVTVGALNVPGAKLTEIILGGSLGADIIEQLPDNLVPGTFEFFQTFSFLQWIVEPADPWLFAPHLMEGPDNNDSAQKPLFGVTYDLDEDLFVLEERLNSNQVMVQLAGDDTTIPNSTTERLATAIGVSLDDTTFPDAPHGFISGDDDAAKCAREQVAVWLTSGFAGEAELGEAQKEACGLAAP